MPTEPAPSLREDARALIAQAWALDPRRVLLQLLALVVGGIVGGVGLLLLVPIVNTVANPAAVLHLPALGDLDLGSIPLAALLALFVLLVAVQALVQWTGTITSSRVQQEIVDSLRQQAFDAVLAARWSFLLEQRRSDVISVVTQGAQRAGVAFQQLSSAAVTAVILVVTAVVALVVAPLVSGIAIVGVALIGVLQARAVAPSYRLGQLYGERSRHLQAVVDDSMDSLRLIRAHDASPVWSRRLAEAFSGAREVQVATVRRSATTSAVASVVPAAAAAALVLLAVAAHVPAASIVVVLLLVARMARQVQQLATTAASLAVALPAVSDLSGLTRLAREAVEVPAGAAGLASFTGEGPLLQLRDATYTYPGGQGGVHGLNLALERGAVIALTGPSGAGKSTTADLVLGLLTPQSGDVLVAGVPLQAGDLAWWRRHIAYVPQETVLIPGTLRDNLTWSAGREASDDECWEALDRAAAAFARGLPDGLDTVLGDRGLRLSGGERQRVALARALLRSPSLLVLDEATSALDDRTEGEVLDLLGRLTPAVTVLVIAHRQSTLAAADVVVHLDQGTVVGP